LAASLRREGRRFGITEPHGHAGDAAPVGEEISELRIHHGPGYRIYFHQQGNTVVILLCGGNKSTQTRDIKTARRLVEEWVD
jgi:putative addiction module killer protein